MADRRIDANPELQALAGTEVIPAQAMSGGTDTASNPVGPGDDIKIKTATLAPWLFALPLNLAKGDDIASASTTDIAAATGNYLHITGTTTITALGTAPSGATRLVVFDGALTLTHHATSLILPTGANITTAAGDCAVFVSEGSGNWRCVVYQRADGRALAQGISIVSTVSSNTITPSADTDLVRPSSTLSAGLTIANPSGTPSDGWSFVVELLDNGTARSLTWGSNYKNDMATLPTTTTAGKRLEVGFSYNASAGELRCKFSQVQP